MKQTSPIRRALIPALMMMLASTTTAMADTTNSNEYTFPRAETPTAIEPYSTTVYTSGLHNIYNMRGKSLINVGKRDLVSFKVSPAGNLGILIEKDKKGNVTAEVYEMVNQYLRKHKFDIKKYGTPTAATFSHDARNILVATDKGIVILDPKKFKPVDRIDLVPIQAEEMLVSPNGYYLVLVNGKDIVVYNYDEKRIRTRIDAETGVADVAFNPDASTMAVLTDDGLLSLYDTRTFDVKAMIDDLGENPKAVSFNGDGKYVAVATDSDLIKVINLVRTSDRREIDVPLAEMNDVEFILDADNNPILTYGSQLRLEARRMTDLEPYYSRLVNDEVDRQMAEWLKMQPGETMEQYNLRVTDESMRRQRRLFEDNISTSLAGDMLAMSNISLGSYDRQNGLLAVQFDNLPQIYLPVPESDVASITSAADLQISEAQYGLLPDDSFELIYAKFLNTKDGKTYIYDNIDRRPMDMLGGNADFVSLDVIRQQQMEEIRLQEVKQQVVAEAKKNNVISDHTNITVDSQVVPAYDADGNKILNYIVKFTYQVEPEFSAVEDFKPGKYAISESGAATSMLNIVRQAFEGDFAQYLKPGKRLNVDISGTADATPIVHGIAYDGSLGQFEDEPVTVDGRLTTISVTTPEGIKTNEQLAFLRAAAVKDYLSRNVKALSDMSTRYNYNVGVSKDKGSEFRRITAEFTFVDAF